MALSKEILQKLYRFAKFRGKAAAEAASSFRPVQKLPVKYDLTHALLQAERLKPASYTSPVKLLKKFTRKRAAIASGLIGGGGLAAYKGKQGVHAQIGPYTAEIGERQAWEKTDGRHGKIEVGAQLLKHQKKILYGGATYERSKEPVVAGTKGHNRFRIGAGLHTKHANIVAGHDLHFDKATLRKKKV